MVGEAVVLTVFPVWEAKRLVKLFFMLCKVRIILFIIMSSAGFWTILSCLFIYGLYTVVVMLERGKERQRKGSKRPLELASQ